MSTRRATPSRRKDSPRAVVQTSQEPDGAERITVRTDPIDDDEAYAVQQALSRLGDDATLVRDELVGPTIGAELRGKALIALGIALLAQMAYLAVRFRWTFGAAAVLAMLHDVLIVVGVFAWLGRPIDGVFLAAILTVVGLSVNDTVVVFDRVRELRRTDPSSPFPGVANRAVLQTVPRTINTGLGAMAILAALVLLGGDSLGDFALALLLGLVVGTLSSVFTATPLLLELSDLGRRRSAAASTGGTRRAREPVAASTAARDRWASSDPYADIPPGR